MKLLELIGISTKVYLNRIIVNVLYKRQVLSSKYQI